MSNRGKAFELLDFTKFAYPSVLGMDAGLTSQNLIERLGGGGFMSYNSIWSRMPAIVEGRATESFIAQEFSFYKDKWKNDFNCRCCSSTAEAFRRTRHVVSTFYKTCLGSRLPF